MSDQQELQRLRDEVRELRGRLNDLERRIFEAQARSAAEAPPVVSAVAVPPVIETPSPATPPPVISASPPPLPATPPVAAKESFEVRLGTYWLPRIGLAVLLTGMVFLVTWSYQYLGRPGKVALSYLCAAVLGGLGLWLERKTPAFGRVLQAGALALAYFVTYALHFVPAFRVVESVPVALGLLVAVVAGIVVVADRKRSPLIAGLALFFGYYTSVISGVDTFTLAANGVLAAAALFFLARNRWVPLSFGAVLGTYLAYLFWVWKINWGADLDRLIFDAGYLSAEQFRLRAAFLGLYWLLFTAGGLVVSREALPVAERKGLLTLNNAFFFVLFTLLMRHAYPEQYWAFFFPFAGALFVTSALASARFAPERSVMDVLFLQAVLVLTVGVLDYFSGTTLMAVLAVESLFLLALARWLNAPWLGWLGRAAYLLAVWVGWPRGTEVWPMWFTAAAGFACVQVERSGRERSGAALYFAVVATALTMRAAEVVFDPNEMPWVWLAGAVVVAGIAGFLRAPEIGWAAHLPLGWAHLTFYWARWYGEEWTLAQAVGLIAVTLAFGLGMWAKQRATSEPERARIAANRVLRPYGIVAVMAVVVATVDYAPKQWRLLVFAGESLVFVIAAILAGETLFVGLAMATMAAGALGYPRTEPGEVARTVAWVNLLGGAALLVAAERLFKWRMADLLFYEQTCRRLRAWMVVIVTGVLVYGLGELTGRFVLTVVWAAAGFGLLVIGFLSRERSYRFAGLVVLTLSLGRAVIYDLSRLETVYRILTYMGLGAILLVLGYLYTKNRDRLAKWL